MVPSLTALDASSIANPSITTLYFPFFTFWREDSSCVDHAIIFRPMFHCHFSGSEIGSNPHRGEERPRSFVFAAILFLLVSCAPYEGAGAALDHSGPAQASNSGPASVDFIDLDGDVVVAPFRWQVLNVDEELKITGKGTLVVLILINGEFFGDFLLDGSKKLSVGFSGADLLPPGE